MQKSGHAQNQAEISKTCVLKWNDLAGCKKLCYKNDPPQATNLSYTNTTDVHITTLLIELYDAMTIRYIYIYIVACVYIYMKTQIVYIFYTHIYIGTYIYIYT